MSLTHWEPGVPHFKQDEPSRYGRAKDRKAAAEKRWREVCAVVDARDGKACRCCDWRGDPNATSALSRLHRHHLVYRSAGGQDVPENIVSLCPSCHDAEHRNRLRIEGTHSEANANEPLIVWRKDAAGVWFIAREETAVRVVMKD